MSHSLPYMATPGTIPKILEKIKEASIPDSFNADFLGTKLGFGGGNQRTFISWAKKCNLLNADGTPTKLYRNFRNPHIGAAAMAEALKTGYSELYVRNEYAHELDRKKITQLVSEITGSGHDSSTVKAIVSSFMNALEFADFEAKPEENGKEEKNADETPRIEQNEEPTKIPYTKQPNNFNLGLNYTINLVLPKTDDPSIYDAIFKSLKDNLLNE